MIAGTHDESLSSANVSENIHTKLKMKHHPTAGQSKKHLALASELQLTLNTASESPCYSG